MIEETLVLFQNIRNPSYDKSLKGYKKVGGFKALKKALKMKPEELVEVVKASGLRAEAEQDFRPG